MAGVHGTESRFQDMTLKVDSLVLNEVAVTATAAEINAAANTASQELTASGAVTPGVRYLTLNHATVVIAATIADAGAHAGLLTITNTSASGTAAHTVTIATGTWNGTNKIATLNAPGESITVSFDAAGAGTVVQNIGIVAFTGT